MKSWHCRHCGHPRTFFRPHLRKWKLERLLVAVRRSIVVLKPGKTVTAEEIATQHRAKKPLVEQCFHRLNLEGLLSQGHNRPPHDSTRDPWGGTDSAWCATTYERL